jgi:hypothetical protein
MAINIEAVDVGSNLWNVGECHGPKSHNAIIIIRATVETLNLIFCPVCSRPSPSDIGVTIFFIDSVHLNKH